MIFTHSPFKSRETKKTNPLQYRLSIRARTIYAQVWRVQAGRVPVFLLDTNIPVNSQEDQDITDQLYAGDRELRMKQEIMLGIGGYRALMCDGDEADGLPHERRALGVSFARAMPAADEGK